MSWRSSASWRSRGNCIERCMQKARPLSLCSPGTPWGPNGPKSPSQRKSLARPTLLRSPLMGWVRHKMCTGGDLHAHPAPFDGVGPRLVVDGGCQQRESKLVSARTEGVSSFAKNISASENGAKCDHVDWQNAGACDSHQRIWTSSAMSQGRAPRETLTGDGVPDPHGAKCRS